MSGNDFCTFGIGNGKWPSLFPAFGIGNGNTKLNSQLLGLGIKNLISNYWDWEWEKIPYSQHLGMGNCISFPKKLGMQLRILKCLFHVKHYVEPAQLRKFIFVIQLEKFILFKVNLTPSTEKGSIETTLFPKKIPNIFG